MSKKHTFFFLNITLKPDEMDYYKVFIESKTTSWRPFGGLTDHPLNFEEKCDEYIENSSLVSRTYYAAIEDFESKNNRIKLKIKTNKNKAYETDLLPYNSHYVNIFYNVTFRSLDNYRDAYRDPPQMKQTKELFQYIQIMKFCVRRNQKDENFQEKIIEKRATESSYKFLLTKISNGDRIEDVLLLCFYMREILNQDQANEFFEKLSLFRVNFLQIPLKIGEFQVNQLIFRLIEEINYTNCSSSTIIEENKFLFIINFILLHKLYYLFGKIKYENSSDKKWIRDGFEKLRTKKEFYRIDQKIFDECIARNLFASI